MARSSIVKKALKSVTQAHPEIAKVSVRNGSGTAWGWVEVTFYLSSPMERDTQWELDRKAEKVAKEALESNGETMYTWTTDNGYDSERSCFITNYVSA